ncbi:hypothetical protein [Bacillus sp. T33-2]|uniref:hypothetical protein n=1 Tax=Bacillus sp. T33-2 TaxID=2054168 RepID=UPI000C76CC57|nr:hypothetical protein [Bacillus sp. T33-2]PLR98413.1 hypothetical protein CVD19_04835 [Bacillus sp. T33-2]
MGYSAFANRVNKEEIQEQRKHIQNEFKEAFPISFIAEQVKWALVMSPFHSNAVFMKLFYFCKRIKNKGVMKVDVG